MPTPIDPHPSRQPVNERPAVTLYRATRGDPDRRRLLTALASSIEGPDHTPAPFEGVALVTAGLVACVAILAAVLG